MLINYNFLLNKFKSFTNHSAQGVTGLRFIGPQPDTSRSCRTMTPDQCLARCACLLPSLSWYQIIAYSLVTEGDVRDNLTKVTLDSTTAGIGPAPYFCYYSG